MNYTGYETTDVQSIAVAIVKALDVPTLVTDVEGIILAITAAAPVGFAGVSPGSNVSDRICNFTDSNVVAALCEADDQGASVNLQFADDHAKSFESEFTIFRVGSGEATVYLWQDRVARAQSKQFEEQGRAHVEMLSGFSVEVRNPLHALMGYAECLLNPKGDNLTDRQREYCNGVLQSGKRLLWLCDQLVDYSKLKSGRAEIDVEPVDAHDLLDTSLSMVRERADQKQIEISLDEPADVMPTIFGDGRRLATVLVNLLDNAIKYTPHGGRAIAGVRFVNSDVFLLVSDTGIGIAPAEQERIFEPFVRGDGDTRRGAGISLALAKQIIEMHGGEITVQSEPGAGSLFIVRIPVVANSGAAAAFGASSGSCLSSLP